MQLVVNNFILKAIENELKSLNVEQIVELYLSEEKNLWIGYAVFKHEDAKYISAISAVSKEQITKDTLTEKIKYEVEQEKWFVDRLLYTQKQDSQDVSDTALDTLTKFMKIQIGYMANQKNKCIDPEDFDKNYTEEKVKEMMKSKKTNLEIFNIIKESYGV